MNKRTRERLKEGLTAAMERWWDGGERITGGPDFFVGDMTLSLMADASLAVLEGVSNVQKYLKTEGMLKE